MYLPSLFGENLMDDFMKDFDGFFGRRAPQRRQPAQNLMLTDVKETDDAYELSVELPGFKKEDLQLELDNGYLKIQAQRAENTEEKDDNGRIIRQERYSGSMARSFYVGEELTEEEIGAKFENGILCLHIPKKEKVEQVPEKKYIAIEG